MKLTAEQRKLLETLPLDVLVDVFKRRRAINSAEKRVAQGKTAIARWQEKISEAEAQLKTLRKMDA